MENVSSREMLCLSKTPGDNSIQFFIIYVPSQQLQGQLQTQHSIGEHNLKSKSNER
jgi:hypothetical protein